MIFLPWVAFFTGVVYMIWQGNKAKKEYVRLKSEGKQRIAAPSAR
jgi:hypothetical protein